MPDVLTPPRTVAPPAPPATATARGPTRHRRWLLIVPPILVVGAVLIWWSTHRTPAVRYTTVTLARGDVTRAVTATGTVNPVLTIIVGTYVSGVIQQLYCDFNTRVKKGQICAKIDPRPYQTAVDQARADLATARAQLIKDHANLSYASITFERNVTLQQHDYVTRDALDNSKDLYDQAQAQMALDTATIAQRQAGLEAAQINLGYTDIVSPVNGTVVSRNVTMGQTVAASFQTPTLFLIATDLTQMEVDANISESDIGGTKEGDTATFTVEAFPDRVFTGVVAQVRQSPQTVQNVVTYDVVVTVNNADLALKPGMTATTRIVTARRRNVLRVSDQALRYVPGGLRGTLTANHLWVLRQGAPVRVDATLGLDDDTYTEIVRSGLEPDDRVIVAEVRKTQAAPGPRL